MKCPYCSIFSCCCCSCVFFFWCSCTFLFALILARFIFCHFIVSFFPFYFIPFYCILYIFYGAFLFLILYENPQSPLNLVNCKSKRVVSIPLQSKNSKNNTNEKWCRYCFILRVYYVWLWTIEQTGSQNGQPAIQPNNHFFVVVVVANPIDCPTKKKKTT